MSQGPYDQCRCHISAKFGVIAISPEAVMLYNDIQE